MEQWNWHKFEVDDGSSDYDDLDPHLASIQSDPQEFVTREFWVGHRDSGYLYIIGFQRVYRDSVIRAFIGEAKHADELITLPKKGDSAWIVSFDRSDSESKYAHVVLNPRQKKDLLEGVASAFYDHYNVCKAGLYVFEAARDELIDIYDSVLGFGKERSIVFKFIPLTKNLNQLGPKRRSYAIITQYY